MSKRRVVVIDVVGLSPRYLQVRDSLPCMDSLARQGRLFNMRPVFPAVTLPVQASLTTGAHPEEHGVVANGFYFPQTFQVSFWEQAAGLVERERVWDRIRRKDPGLTSAVIFFQNSLYGSSDVVITPRPLHTEEGLIQWCYSKPVGFYEEICGAIGEFNLFHFWGPMASIESSRWIAKAAVETMARVRPNLMFVYLPHLDYCSQKYGPGAPPIREELRQVDQEVERIVRGIQDMNLGGETIFIVLSEYVFNEVKGDVPLNRLLRNDGLVKVRTIRGREYLDLEMSSAFAMVDHQIAHIYIKPGYRESVRKSLQHVEGIDLLLDEEGKRRFKINHPRSGDIIAVSARNRWFSYPWWEERSKEPDFATHVDIHRKPGYDPLELYLEPGTRKISQDTSLIRGSHGYPATTVEDACTFLISGDVPADLDVSKDVCVTDVAGIIERLLTDVR